MHAGDLGRAILVLGLALAPCGAGAGASEPTGGSEPPPPQTEIQEARSLAKAFMERLQGELQAALQQGGAAAAIGICRTEAPSIAGELSRQRDWAVGRTALRVRNPRNAPSVRERAILMQFQLRAEGGEELAGMEHAAVVEEDGLRYLHYMKAIPTAGLCLTCHGSSLAPEVQEAVHALYPSDAATGFEQGELRGAFSFVKPLSTGAGTAPAP